MSVNEALKKILLIPGELERELEYSETVARANLHPDIHKRPSMELGIHTLLPFKYILHFHSPCGLIAAYLRQEQRFLSLPSPTDFGFSVSWLDFCLPGFSLAEQILKLDIAHSPNPQLIILKNHGVVLCCDKTPQEILDQYANWETVFWKATGNVYPYEKTSDRRSLYDFATRTPHDLRPLYPDSVILENRISRVAERATGSEYRLNPKAAMADSAAADIFSVECLIKKTFPDIGSIEAVAQQKIRNMPTEIARKKLFQGVK